MKNLGLLLFALILLTSCNSPTSSCEIADEPSLKITNNACGIIEEVSLVGYDFKNLAIGEGESKIFNLGDGMSAGLDNVNVNVIATTTTRGFNGSITVDFMSGQTASIELIKVSYPTTCSANNFGLQLDE